jgi:hypothetical protein
MFIASQTSLKANFSLTCILGLNFIVQHFSYIGGYTLSPRRTVILVKFTVANLYVLHRVVYSIVMRTGPSTQYKVEYLQSGDEIDVLVSCSFTVSKRMLHVPIFT